MLQKEEKVQEENADGKLTSLHPKKKIAFPLTERIQLSHNVFLFRFGLPSEEHTLGLPVGQHVFIYGKVRILAICCLVKIPARGQHCDLTHSLSPLHCLTSCAALKLQGRQHDRWRQLLSSLLPRTWRDWTLDRTLSSMASFVPVLLAGDENLLACLSCSRLLTLPLTV